MGEGPGNLSYPKISESGGRHASGPGWAHDEGGDPALGCRRRCGSRDWLKTCRIVLLSRRSAPGSDPLGEVFSCSGTSGPNSNDQSPEQSDGTTLQMWVLEEPLEPQHLRSLQPKWALQNGIIHTQHPSLRRCDARGKITPPIKTRVRTMTSSTGR